MVRPAQLLFWLLLGVFARSSQNAEAPDASLDSLPKLFLDVPAPGQDVLRPWDKVQGRILHLREGPPHYYMTTTVDGQSGPAVLVMKVR
jgi:hypothetical protein